MISSYESNSLYHVFETSETSKKFKIGEIQNNLFFDVDKKGKRIGKGIKFNNTYAFWSQFHKVQVEKISKPLDGFEPIVWGAYWVMLVLGTILLVGIAENIEGKIFWLVFSTIHLALTIKYRNNKYVVYWMTAVCIVIVIFVYLAGTSKKK